jgi:hypothetical protein
MYCILINAKISKKRKAEAGSELLIGCVKNGSDNNTVKYLLTVDGIQTVASIPNSVYYYIADIIGDVPRTNLAQCFTMVVASDDAGKTEFRKRVKEARKSGYTYVMVSPTREQMHLMFQHLLATDEIDFRLDVVGCNPRELGNEFDTYQLNHEFDELVKETCADILGCSETDADKSRFNWAMGVVMQAIYTATVEDSKITMSSMFREDIVEERQVISVFTSTFMCFLAGKIRDKFQKIL